MTILDFFAKWMLHAFLLMLACGVVWWCINWVFCKLYNKMCPEDNEAV